MPHLPLVHLTLGIQAALSFFWLDGFAVPAPAPQSEQVRESHLGHKSSASQYIHILSYKANIDGFEGQNIEL
jgi:hypothetical protein